MSTSPAPCTMRCVFLLGLSLCALMGVAPAPVSSSSVLRSEGPPVFFLKDGSDESCLAGGAFKRCGLDALWFVSGKKAGAYQLHRRPLEGEDDSDEDEDQCLMK